MVGGRGVVVPREQLASQGKERVRVLAEEIQAEDGFGARQVEALQLRVEPGAGRPAGMHINACNSMQPSVETFKATISYYAVVLIRRFEMASARGSATRWQVAEEASAINPLFEHDHHALLATFSRWIARCTGFEPSALSCAPEVRNARADADAGPHHAHDAPCLACSDGERREKLGHGAGQ